MTLSLIPPMIAVLPSAERETLYPCNAPQPAKVSVDTPVPTSFPPSCHHRITSYNVCYTKLLRSMTVKVLSGKLPQNEARVLPPEPERVGKDHIEIRLPCPIRNIVEIAGRIRL